jgi:hypothetical protein
MINLPKLNAKSLPIYGTYDQGSTRQPPMLNLYDDYLSDSPIIIASIAAIISFIYFLEQRSKINMLRFMAAKIYRDLREVAMMKLESDLHNDKILVDDKLLDGRGMYSNRLWANPKFEGMKIKFFNKVDIDKLYKFFAFLLDRDSVIKYVKPEHESFVARLRDANYKLNRAAQDAYKDINWEKYAGFKFIKILCIRRCRSKDDCKIPYVIYSKRSEVCSLSINLNWSYSCGCFLSCIIVTHHTQNLCWNRVCFDRWALVSMVENHRHEGAKKECK